MKFDPYPKNVLDLPIRNKYSTDEIWDILQLFSSSAVFWIMLQNILKVVLWWAVSKIMHTYSPYLRNIWMYSLKTCAIGIGTSKKTYIHGVSSHFEEFFLVKIEFIFSIAFPIWKPYFFLKNTQIWYYNVCFSHKTKYFIQWHKLSPVHLTWAPVYICCIMFNSFFYFILLHSLFVFILHLFVFYFIFGSELLRRTSSQTCGRWYLPTFLFRDGLLTFMYIDSFMNLKRLGSSLPTILKLSSVVLWPVMLKWSNIGNVP